MSVRPAGRRCKQKINPIKWKPVEMFSMKFKTVLCFLFGFWGNLPCVDLVNAKSPFYHLLCGKCFLRVVKREQFLPIVDLMRGQPWANILSLFVQHTILAFPKKQPNLSSILKDSPFMGKPPPSRYGSQSYPLWKKRHSLFVFFQQYFFIVLWIELCCVVGVYRDSQ